MKELKKSTLKSDFLSRLKTMIKSSVPYYYPEAKGTYLPDIKSPIVVETSFIQNVINYKKLLKKLKDEFDLEKIQYVFDNLADEYSKETYLHVICYRLFDSVKLRMPIYYDQYLYDFDKYNYLLIDNTAIEVPNGTLNKWDLKPLGYNLKLIFGNRLALSVMFIREQYKYLNKNFVKENDIIIDGGACYGDTSLYYLDKINGKGKVYAFEFIDKNLEIFNENLNLNPHYKDNIEIIKRPLWSNSHSKLFTAYNASMSCVTTNSSIEYTQELTSISIDDFVKDYNIDKIDLIKLDIEGCELEALKGAKESIQKFKPKLQICLYHKKEDLWELPIYIKQLVPEYKLMINHNTLCTDETIMFAEIEMENN